MTTAPTRPQPLPEHKNDAVPVKTRGHLALLEWDEQAAPAALPPFHSGTRRTFLDRCYTGGTFLLFVTTIAALAASLCRF